MLVKVLYLFAGKRRQSDIGAFLNKMEATGKIQLQLLEFDIERSEDHDLRSKAMWEEICDKLKEGGWFFDRQSSLQHLFQSTFPVATVSWPKAFEESHLAERLPLAIPHQCASCQ